MDGVQETSPSNIYDGVQGNDIGNQAALPSASNGAGNDNTLLVDNDEESVTETEEKDDDDSVGCNNFGNQATLPSASNGAGYDNTALVDNVAQKTQMRQNKPPAMINLILKLKRKIMMINLHPLGFKIFREF
jgi:hypothetical protein